MSVSRDTSKGTWTVYARYTDWQGKVKVLHKRGFKAKRDALQYEREYLLKKAKDVNMGFACAYKGRCGLGQEDSPHQKVLSETREERCYYGA